jgi:hypothetical protein
LFLCLVPSDTPPEAVTITVTFWWPRSAKSKAVAASPRWRLFVLGVYHLRLLRSIAAFFRQPLTVFKTTSRLAILTGAIAC